MNLVEIAQTRYATKKFDGSKRIPSEVFDQIKALLRLSPSSVNSQPWHFVIAETPESRKRMSQGTQGVYSANESKVLDASHVILFCAKTEMDDNYLLHLLESEDKDGRFPSPESKEMVKKVRAFYADLHRQDLNDTQSWMEKQVYLNMGTILLGAGVLGVDSVPIEGVDVAVLNEEFDLINQGYTAMTMMALGYRDEEDLNAALPKSRLPEEEIFTILK
ncbi:oxygen-insensitive NAD(P)H nitroreductase [Hydrogenovibrio sp. 3SP14C1]|uniref:oxygen-insensitive NAD(P)H nitroreductase n=1 Tax=Hydrogenovibrio sp. 3SP14C1 TaxID=3038774 RepID=UPI002417700E|nr:oxygen-insensitive NAD(P)H nitroreductase [Hydrogenovibrio sp. 3SP14C1]MDG4813437.1 oxygen-insensitive NAD(P)H nitroreductase [Hydrogenovibrio sp. 3SP14C1]